MNWTAGILAFVLVYVPVMCIFYTFHERNKEIDRKYEEEMKRIGKKFGVEL